MLVITSFRFTCCSLAFPRLERYDSIWSTVLVLLIRKSRLNITYIPAEMTPPTHVRCHCCDCLESTRNDESGRIWRRTSKAYREHQTLKMNRSHAARKRSNSSNSRIDPEPVPPMPSLSRDTTGVENLSASQGSHALERDYNRWPNHIGLPSRNAHCEDTEELTSFLTTGPSVL